MKKYKNLNKYKKKKLKFLSSLPIISTLLLIASTILIITLFKIDLETQQKKSEYNKDTKVQFIEDINFFAQKNYKNYGVLPSITIAQAILESDWGRSQLSKKYQNYFGIKSFNKNEKRVIFSTTEYVNNKKVEIKDAFRAYDNMEQSVKSHGLLLGTAPRYKKVIQSSNYQEAAKMLYECGYATDPNYSDMIIELIQQYKLYKYD